MELLSVVVANVDRLDETVACLDALRSQSLDSLQVLLMDPCEDDAISAKLAEAAAHDPRLSVVDVCGLNLAEIRDKALTLAQGKYISFVSASDGFETPYALELLAMTAESENAQVVGGETLAASVFDRNWLVESGIRFYCWSASDDPFFMRLVRVKAPRCVSFGRTLVTCGRDVAWERNTESDRDRNLIEALGQVWQFVKEQNAPEFFAAFEDLLFGHGLESLRAGAWSRDVAERDWYRSRLESLEQEKITDEILNPLVSVIVPAYKVEQYLPRCLDSLVAQTLASIEIIVVDDGSPDKCGEIADDYARRFWNIHVVHQKNGGRGAARNSGLSAARGKYVGFVDSDDFVEPSMYEELSQALEEDARAELAMCGAHVEYAYDAPENEIRAMQRYFDVPGEGGVDLSPELVTRLNATCWAYLYRRDFLGRNRIRFPVGVEGEDEVLFFQVFAYATRIHFVPNQLYRYILNEQGTMAQQPREFKESGKLPDILTKDIPLLLAFIERVDRHDLIGLLYRKLAGVSYRYESERVFRIVARILHDTHFVDNREFICGQNFAWYKDRLSAIANYPLSDEMFPLVNEDLLPQQSAPILAVEKPLLTYIVPVYNAADYLAVCIDSLRRQTLRDIEIICIDDGSIDRSGEILDEIAKVDLRIRVIHQENAGVGAARNRGIQEAKGKYIAFVDADDYLDLQAAEDSVALCEKYRLDACRFDFIVFDTKNRQNLDHWYLLSHHPDIPWNRVFSPRELQKYEFNAGMWTGIFNRDFFRINNIEFPTSLKIGEDGVVLYRFLSLANRIFVKPKAYYHYRRGNPTSAVSRLTAGVGTQVARDAQVKLARYYAQHTVGECASRLGSRNFSAFLQRVFSDVLFYAEKNESVAQLVQTECRQELLVDSQTAQTLGDGLYQRLQKVLSAKAPDENETTPVLPGVPRWVKRSIVERLQEVTEARKSAQQDLYLVTGQLNSKTNEPIDSWTFFTWLQDHNIPSRYLIWRKHAFYKKLVREGKTKDVVALKGDGCTDYEILDRHSDLLIRAKALVQENVALNPILWRWIVNLPGCERIFLQHGIMFWKGSDLLFLCIAMNNDTNVSSAREKEFLEEHVIAHPDVGKLPRYIVAGLPRYDLLKDEREPNRSEFVLFVMFTWRNTFGADRDKIAKSAYCLRIREFLRPENLKRLKRNRVRVVVSIHHSLLNRMPDFVLNADVDVAPTDKVSYWIRHADACLTDFSSVSFDFAFLHKPTIYWIPDAEDVTLNPQDRSEIDFARHQAKNFYNVVGSEDGALQLIETYAKKNFVLEPEKCAIADTFFAYRENVCQHVYEGIEAVIKERQNEQ
jgi:glycosyltransferase involved in cell wall biosynthesis